ncbi:MAG: preprotein translocase subunit Sec61beta [Candidatus Methylarchaceae archaeon HK02M2]|nr:preprotein translocase subunit Sec61beta [Candidatus Methylarchaceae archaeon HK02M2]
MSSKKKKKSGSPMPVSSAGLLRFFEDESRGAKVRPEIVMAVAIGIVIISILLNIFLSV